MPRQSSIPFRTSSQLTVPHGMFSCLGGVSEAPFASLNLSLSVGDTAENVHINRARSLASLGLTRLLSVKQVHGNRILQAEAIHVDTEPDGYDAIISTLAGTGLLIQQADCQAILLYSPQPPVVAAIHCGWRGSVQGIIGTTIACLQQEYGVASDAIRAVISPSLGPCCAEFINYRRELPSWMQAYQVRPNHFDFWAISHRQLVEAGVKEKYIDITGLCTVCNDQFFSYRRSVRTSGGITGRNGSIIGLPK